MPGAFLGVMPMDHVSHALGVQVNHWLTISVGAPLMGIALTLVLEDRITQLLGVQRLSLTNDLSKPVLIGMFVGILLGE